MEVEKVSEKRGGKVIEGFVGDAEEFVHLNRKPKELQEDRGVMWSLERASE